MDVETRDMIAKPLCLQSCTQIISKILQLQGKYIIFHLVPFLRSVVDVVNAAVMTCVNLLNWVKPNISTKWNIPPNSSKPTYQ